MIFESLLVDVEKSALGELIRSLGSWTYAFINRAHIIGVATLFGAVLILDLRLIGWRRKFNLADVATITLPFAKVGFVVSAISGICMLSVNATEYIGNPFIIIKFGALFVALFNAVLIHHVAAWKSQMALEPATHNGRSLAMFGFVSLVAWLTVVSAGRMIAYW